MIDIIKNLIDLTMQLINGLYNMQVDITPGVNVSLGELVIGFLIVILTIYFVFVGLGIISKGDD